MKWDKVWDDVSDIIEDAIDDFFGEVLDEAKDFFGNFFKRTPPSKRYIGKQEQVYGMRAVVRPAYRFAERVENSLKILFGTSIVISALVAAFWGFTRLSELLQYLIGSIGGRLVMVVIGLSYMTIGLWKLIHLRD